MARGWESKSVEMQMEERALPERSGPNSHANAAAEREIEILKLSRARLLVEMAAIENPRLRQLKQRALEHVEAQISALAACEPR